MSDTINLEQRDIQRKNNMMLVSFSIAIIGALLVTIVNSEPQKTMLYAIGLTIYVCGYIVLKYILKKDNWFPYFMVLIGYFVMTLYVFIFNGSLATIGIMFFLLFLSTAHFYPVVFAIGYILGLVNITLINIKPEPLQADTIHDSFLSVIVAYLLSGIVSFIVIHLNGRQFRQLRLYVQQSNKL